MNTDCYAVLQRSYIQPFSLQSNYAREQMGAVAELASRGLITTHVGHNVYSHHWRVSQVGLHILEELQGEK